MEGREPKKKLNKTRVLTGPWGRRTYYLLNFILKINKLIYPPSQKLCNRQENYGIIT